MNIAERAFRMFGMLAVCASVAFSLPLASFAAMPDVVATPAVIDGKGKVREILRFNIVMVNTSGRLVSVYPWVTDFDPYSGTLGATDLGGSGNKALHESLARWIEVTRGSVDLLPGEQKEIPLTVQVNLSAKPGVYHATLHLSQGSDRASAEADRNATQSIPINIEVLEDINERLQLAAFTPEKNVFSGETASFQYRIENIGNRGEVPRGKVRIFDRNGREVAVVDANKDGTRLEPEASALLSSAWASGGEFGRYKAMLDLEYGSRGTIQDTVFFWVMPWGKLLSMFLSLILAFTIIALLVHARMTARPEAAYAYQTEGEGGPGRAARLLGALRSRRARDDERESDMERESSFVNEMREVSIPHPVRSRVPERGLGNEGTRIPSRPEQITPSSHQVTLVKREKPVSPHHVVNLRK